MMQWLIDICVERILDEIGIPPVYIHRGDPAAWDFATGDFTKDLEWRTLDLSPIVPAAASAVRLRCSALTSMVGPFIMFRHPSVTHGFNLHWHKSPLAFVLHDDTFTVAVDTNRHIDYLMSDVGILVVSLLVCGWWL